ncbi:MAG: MotA/TolQ/ExbB proton channel family protein [Epsilonproteobacteria bacterium]|nr:MotA/TolQ/ExbB proton channel family protein [Campylobacterota bacterium]
MFDYLLNSSAITIVVIGTLSLYFIATWSIFIYRYRLIKKRIEIEAASEARLYRGEELADSSLLYNYLKEPISKEYLEAIISDALRVSTKGLTQLSIMASTSPFIGLFGTVVGILEAFAGFSTKKSATLAVVAPAISEALIATAVGIFVAIFAYSFHLILKRKAYELNSILESESKLLLSRKG